MTDSPRRDSKRPPQVNQEMFARFLELLAPDPEDAGRRYTNLHKRLIGLFRMKGLTDPVSAADETLDRAIVKIAAGAVVPDVDKYCLGIAQNIAKEKYRLIKREESALRKFILELSESSGELVEKIYAILKPCFEKLPLDEQQLLLAYCRDVQGQSRAKFRRRLAEALGISVLALRIRVTRLRNRLSDCVQKRANEGPLENFDT